MKRTAKTTLMLGLLLLGGFSVSAQKRLFPQEARLPLSSTPELWIRMGTAAERLNGIHRIVEEESLLVRDWMIDRETWYGSGGTELARATVPEVEVPLQVEDWMVDTGLRDRTKQLSLSELIRVEKEPPIELQKWMICCTDWMKTTR